MSPRENDPLLPSADRPDITVKDGVSMSRRRAILLAISMFFLILLQASNMSGIAILQSPILTTHPSLTPISLTVSYLLPLSAFTPPISHMTTLFPPRILILPISFLIGLGNFLTAVSPNATTFLVGRALAGIGGAGSFNMAVILIVRLCSVEKRGRYLAAGNVGFTIGLSFGAMLYGKLAELIGWRGVYMGQIPFAFIYGLGIFLAVPSTADRRGITVREGLGVWTRLAMVDYFGVILLVIGISSFLYGLTGTVDWPVLAASMLTCAAFVKWETSYTARPIIPVSILMSRRMAFACVAQVIFVAARWSLLFYGPIYMLAVKGHSRATAGSILIPTNFSYGGASLIIGWLHIRRGGSFLAATSISFVTFAASMVFVSWATGRQDVWFFVAVFINGMATGGGLNYSLAHILHQTRDVDHGVATGLLGTFRGFGGSFGTSIGGGIFIRLLRKFLENGFEQIDGERPTPDREALIKSLIGQPEIIKDLPYKDQAVAIAAYSTALKDLWYISALVALGAAILILGCGHEGAEDEEHDGSEE